MFRIESYVTPILLSYVDKYVKDFKPADAQVSLWGGGVALHNLVLKADVLQQEVALPFTLVSGRIHELLIQVPWTKIMSEPIVVTIDTIECILSLNPPASNDEAATSDTPSPKPHVVEAPPGYMQALVRRIVSNIALRVHHLIVKYVHDDIVLSLNVKHLAVDSAGADWEPAFADIDQSQPLIRRLVGLDDLTLCLDRADSDGKIRFYQEPLLYRCQLELRVLTKLVSANTRRARSLNVHMQSSKLAWGVTSDQLTLLLRLMRERSVDVKPPTPAPRGSTTSQNSPQNNPSSTSEPTQSESWSEWAWSWLPTWMDRDGIDEAPTAPAPIPVNFTAFLDDVSLVFKVMENESNSRKRARSFLELTATYAAIKSYICAPTVTRVYIGTRNLIVLSKGKCVCGHIDYNALNEEPTVYLRKIQNSGPQSTWSWPKDHFKDVEMATAVDECYRSSPDITENKEQRDTETQMSDLGIPEEPTCVTQEQKNDAEDFWTLMGPLVFIEYSHERMPPSIDTNPYESPPIDFQYSDWVEESMMKITIKPVEVFVCMTLLHRLSVFKTIYQELPPVPTPEITLRVLTVEECEALTDNLPQRRITLEVLGLRVRLSPWDHSLSERPTPPSLFLDLDLPKSVMVVNGPLYPIRVCTAACQIPEDASTIWQGARLHVTVNTSVAFAITSPSNKETRPCARTEIKAVAHTLLNSQLFTKKGSVLLGFSIKVVEANVCGSFARLYAALEVPMSLFRDYFSNALRCTSLAYDALNDEELVAIDITLEDMVLRGYRTSHIRTHILILQSAKATALHDQKKGEVKQAWLFSAPDAPTSSPYLRFAVQWCIEPVPYSIDYLGVWTEPTAVAVDPLFIAWLAYKPIIKTFTVTEPTPQMSLLRNISSTQFFLRRRATPPSSSGRGGSKSGSGADMIHMRTRSATSSDKAESRDAKHTPNQEKEKSQSLWSSDHMLALHERLRRMYVNVELGLTLVYITMTTASAVDCDTIREAMEWHSSEFERVLAVSLGRIFLFSSLINKHFWHEINHDGPTVVPEKKVDAAPKEGFPWRMRLADISCYTLEVSPTERYTRDTNLRSQLKTFSVATPKTVLELVTTSVTLSVVTKSVQYKTLPKPEPKVKKEAPKAGEAKLKYFKGGLDFKPTTLKEFVRGPAHRKKSMPEVEVKKPSSPNELLISAGPLVSIGVNIHADTPPLIIRLEQNQVRVVSSAVHCFAHIAALLRRTTPQQRNAYTSFGGSQRSLGRSVSEIQHGDETPSDHTLSEKSELISIFEAKSAMDDQIDVKTFFWFQWVVSHVNIVVATQQVKLAFDVDDIISTVDLQNHYNQLKIKVASASIRYFQKNSADEWTAGSLAGRVLEAREPTNSKEDNHFLSITITQARISNLPASWKQELHPKLLEEKSAADSMWEIYATLAPLEAVIQPKVLSHIRYVIHEMSPRSFCPLKTDRPVPGGVKHGMWQWPFLYVSAGGLRLLVTREHESSNKDDTFIFVMGKASISPHPENPICRRIVNAASDWTTPAGGLEGRQYEILVRHVAVRSSRFQQLVNEENSVAESLTGGTGSENPALKWTQTVVKPVITPVLHSVDIGCVIAPPYFNNNALVCGPAIELNLVSDCALEFSLEQLVLASKIVAEMRTTIRDTNDSVVLLTDHERSSICPYASLLMTQLTADVGTEKLSTVSEATIDAEPSSMRAPSDTFRSLAADSGVDSITPLTFRKLEDSSGQVVGGLKKIVSVAFLDSNNAEAAEHLEIFITMGMIEVSLYTVDDNTPTAVSLRPPEQFQSSVPPEPDSELQTPETVKKDSKQSVKTDDGQRTENASAPSLTENVRNIDIGKTKLELPFPHARKCEGNLPLLHLTLYQPNLYYWRRKTQKTLQVSLFNAWLGLGAGQYPGLWHEELFSTARGVSDPLTDIRPALATLKVVVPLAGSQSIINNIVIRGNARLDIERPIMFEVSSDRLRRLKTIYLLLIEKLGAKSVRTDLSSIEAVRTSPFLNKLKRMFVNNAIENITIQMSQVAVSGSEGVAGWDTASVQLTAGARPERLLGRALITALVISTGPPGDTRHVLLDPLVLGLNFQATWEAWRRAEGGIAAREPMIRVTCELDQVTFDVRPFELAALARMYAALDELMKKNLKKSVVEEDSSDDSTASAYEPPLMSTITFESRPSIVSIDAPEEHFYKDDLRSGAFKLVSGGQLPMAYQVTLHNEAVSWRYPHPRAITRLLAFPLPGQDVETPCVLELYDFQLNRWDRHTFFKIPVGEPLELLLYVTPPDAVFSVMWRYRACRPTDQQYQPYEFDINKFMPGTDTTQVEQPPETQPSPNCTCTVTAEQLSGVVRVDSCFSPRAVPRVRLVTRVARFDLHLHNDPPSVASNTTSLEGYYVSKPLMRSHRVLTLAAKDLTAHAQLASPAGTLLLLETTLMSDCINCTTGTMEPVIEDFHLEGGLSFPTDAMARARVALSHVYAALHVPRLRTLHALARDWNEAIELNFRGQPSSSQMTFDNIHSKYEDPDVTAAALEGLVSLWILNTCAYALRVGQEGTDELVPLGSGASLAYRWRCPNAPKKLRFAIVSPSTDWLWSTSIPFSVGSHRVQLHDSGQSTVTTYLYIKTEEIGSRKSMTLSGRLCLANMLRNTLLYKVRGHSSDEKHWRTLCSGEILGETLEKSVVCGVDAEMALKIKFVNQETGWSGDIPLRECPKENVPWLVKVPRESEQYPYMSVWCRVMRARSDGRILASIWPLYMLYSHLPLDSDVIIESEGTHSNSDLTEESTKRPPAVVQPIPGRGTCTHLLVPGTTAARHMLTFQYSDIQCPVTHEPVPLHYGVTDTSVFEKRPPIGSIDEVMQETADWLKRCGHDVMSSWPYSIVTKHWPGQWKHASIQPRCDVVVRYQAVRAGGGCSLEVQLCPVVLLCNAAPIALTLRAHDAAPLCKLEPGSAISPPSGILKKSFFISVEMGRDTFVSGELSVSGAELGRYGAAPPGRVALDRPAELAIQCNHKVAMLTMYYEIKEDINVLGMSSTYVLVNSMETDISISAIALPNVANKDTVIRPNCYKVVEPTRNGSIHGMSLCRFWVWGRWRGSDPEELRLYLFVALSPQSGVTCSPIRLGHPPVRRAIALTDADGNSVPVVVTQVKHEGRWVVRVARDPCPQLLVHNRTHMALLVAQPAQSHDEPGPSKVLVQQECLGTKWFCVIEPETKTHYSTPLYCARYPPPPNAPTSHDTIAFLTFAKNRDDSDPDWCAPVAATDGEQLVQLKSGMTVKLRVRTHPHSTYLELRDVDERDISASDIRKRLFALNSAIVIESDDLEPNTLERTDAEEKLLGSQRGASITGGASINEDKASIKEDKASIKDDKESVKEDKASIKEDKVSQRTSVSLAADVQPLTPKPAASLIDRQSAPDSLLILSNQEQDDAEMSQRKYKFASAHSIGAETVFRDVSDPEWEETASWSACERMRVVAASIGVALAVASDTRPLVALHLERAAVTLRTDARRTKITISAGDFQIDNLQYESGQYDFGVVASTRAGGSTNETERIPPIWNLFAEKAFTTKIKEAKMLLKLTYDSWEVLNFNYNELTEIEISIGPLALYIEDLYVTSIAHLLRRVTARADAGTEADAQTDDGRSLQRPFSLRLLHIHPLDLTLTLHTAVRMYIALDQSPLRLSAFKLNDTMTSAERLTHALTVHYLSAAILGAGWVVGGLELLGAPGALAARVGGATGGVRGVASAAAAALLRSLSAWAGSLARNLDLLAGDEEHARRAAAARRRPPPSFMAGLAAGITNFAINILGAVGGLAHHPLVGVAVGESDSGATGLRRGLLGALAKPLSATADLVAFAGHGLLSQTGWDSVPQPCGRKHATTLSSGWRRDCVRWSFRLSELTAITGFHVLLGSAALHLLITHKFLVVADPDSERIIEMIDFKFCSIGTYQGQIIELSVTQRRQSRVNEARAIDEDDEYQVSAAAMARVARYTGAEGTSSTSTNEVRVLSLLPAPGYSHALHAALTAAVHHNADSHFALL